LRGTNVYLSYLISFFLGGIIPASMQPQKIVLNKKTWYNSINEWNPHIIVVNTDKDNTLKK